MENDSHNTEATNGDVGSFAYHELDRAMHERARLGIMMALTRHAEGLLFNNLKSLCDLTDGNLSRHLGVLQEAGLIEVWKGHKQKRSLTLCRVTPDGRRQFRDYLRVLKDLANDGLTTIDRSRY